MNNVMNIDGHDAVIELDPEKGMLRGEFVNLNGGADFYAPDVKGLEAEGRESLRIFLEVCEEADINPVKKYSGKLNVRFDPKLHEKIVVAAAAAGESLNQLIVEAVQREIIARNTFGQATKPKKPASKLKATTRRRRRAG